MKFQRGYGIASYQGVLVKISVCYYLVGLLFLCRPEVPVDKFCFDLDSVSPKSFPAKFRINGCTFRRWNVVPLSFLSRFPNGSTLKGKTSFLILKCYVIQGRAVVEFLKCSATCMMLKVAGSNP